MFASPEGRSAGRPLCAGALMSTGERDASGRPGFPLASRRGLLAGGVAAGLAAGVAACGSGPTPAVQKLSPAQRRVDVELLNRLLDLEHQAIAAYTAGIPLLAGRTARVAKQFLRDEVAHAGELFSLVKRQHGKPHRPQAAYDLGHPQTREEVLRLLHDVERAQIRAYLSAIPLLAPGGARSALAAILGNDAQHVALVRQALGAPALLGPLVSGAE